MSRQTIVVGDTLAPHGGEVLMGSGTDTIDGKSLSELLCVRHKLMAKEPRYATQTQGRSAGRTGQGIEPGPGTD
ncbi:hypothetical protein LGN35_30415, partial [Burkholderia multivorans]|nr:hypothetical protein [Burkholderia multivorans]